MDFPSVVERSTFRGFFSSLRVLLPAFTAFFTFFVSFAPVVSSLLALTASAVLGSVSTRSRLLASIVGHVLGQRLRIAQVERYRRRLLVTSARRQVVRALLADVEALHDNGL